MNLNPHEHYDGGDPALQPYCEHFVCWAEPRDADDPFSHEHPSDVVCDWGWACSHCAARVDDTPCEDHAPVVFAGLRLVECRSDDRRHWFFVHLRDDYGANCPGCWGLSLWDRLKPLEAEAQRRAHRWCWLLNRAKRLAIGVGVARSCGWSSDCNGRGGHTDIRWRWW